MSRKGPYVGNLYHFGVRPSGMVGYSPLVRDQMLPVESVRRPDPRRVYNLRVEGVQSLSQ